MSERVTSREFAAALARRTGKSAGDMTLFLQELQSVVEQGLTEDGLVKISGLGTFRLVWNEPRRSVNVQTGDAIEIAGHYKVSFTPDASLRDIVNEPLAHLEVVELPDDEPRVATEETGDDDYELPIQKLADQAEALKDILSDIQGGPLFTPDIEPMDEADDGAVTSVEDEVGAKESEKESEGEAEDIVLADVGTEEPTGDGVEGSVDAQFGSEEGSDEVTDTGERHKADMERVASYELPAEEVGQGLSADIGTESDSIAVEGHSEVSAAEDNEAEGGVEDGLSVEHAGAGAVYSSDDKDGGGSGSKDDGYYSAKEMAASVPISVRKRRRTWGHVLLAVLAVAAVASGVIFVYDNWLWDSGLSDEEGFEASAVGVEELPEARDMTEAMSDTAVLAEEETLHASVPLTPAATEEAAEVKEECEAVTVAKVPSSAHIEMFDRERRYCEFSDTVEITRGSRLAWIAYKRLGNKVFWPYIYEANMDHISDPNNISVGTLLRVPILPSELTDTTNPECIKYARELHRHYAK